MQRTVVITILLLAAGIVASSLKMAGAQRRSYSSQARAYSQRSFRRIEALEQRVAALERQIGRRAGNAIPAGTTLTVERAEQQFAAAEQRFDFSKELHRKGYISDAELERDQFALERMRRILRLASAAPDSEPFLAISREIEVADAEHDLAVAERQLGLAKRIAAQGFFGPSGVDAHRQAVEDARQKVGQLKATESDESDQN